MAGSTRLTGSGCRYTIAPFQSIKLYIKQNLSSLHKRKWTRNCPHLATLTNNKLLIMLIKLMLVHIMLAKNRLGAGQPLKLRCKFLLKPHRFCRLYTQKSKKLVVAGQSRSPKIRRNRGAKKWDPRLEARLDENKLSQLEYRWNFPRHYQSSMSRILF